MSASMAIVPVLVGCNRLVWVDFEAEPSGAFRTYNYNFGEMIRNWSACYEMFDLFFAKAYYWAEFLFDKYGSARALSAKRSPR